MRVSHLALTLALLAGLAACGKGPQAMQAHPDLTVPRAMQARLVPRDLLDLQARRVKKDRRVRPVRVSG